MADGSGVVANTFVGLGSNIEAERHLRMACAELAADCGPLRLSAVYRSRAVGFDGDDFLNMVVGLRSDEEPARLIDRLEALHVSAGRVRLPNPFSPRTLDADLLLCRKRVEPDLKLPHPDIETYPFVLRPLAELAPDLRHPVLGCTLAELWARYPGERDLVPVDLGLGSALD